jgi:hypothetical protein
LILIVHSCQLSKPTVAHVSFGVGIFRCENAVFSQSGERVSKFALERVPTAFRPRSNRVPTAFQPRSDRVPTAFRPRSNRIRNAFGTRSERERSVRLFLSSTVYNPTFHLLKPLLCNTKYNHVFNGIYNPTFHLLKPLLCNTKYNHVFIFYFSTFYINNQYNSN